MKNTNLRSCPFCGGDAFIHSRYARSCGSYFVFIRCDECGANSRALRTRQAPALSTKDPHTAKVIEAWNRRDPEPAAEEAEPAEEVREECENDSATATESGEN